MRGMTPRASSSRRHIGFVRLALGGECVDGTAAVSAIVRRDAGATTYRTLTQPVGMEWVGRLDELVGEMQYALFLCVHADAAADPDRCVVPSLETLKARQARGIWT
jgi:hypothetical protein